MSNMLFQVIGCVFCEADLEPFIERKVPRPVSDSVSKTGMASIDCFKNTFFRIVSPVGLQCKLNGILPVQPDS